MQAWSTSLQLGADRPRRKDGYRRTIPVSREPPYGNAAVASQTPDLLRRPFGGQGERDTSFPHRARHVLSLHQWGAELTAETLGTSTPRSSC